MDPLGRFARDRSVEARAVESFTENMLAKLQANSHKAHWSTVSNEWLFMRLLQEVTELYEAIHSGNGVISESADVANFAMMIADNARRGAGKDGG
jgi:NTP pyrophosphatase (non-canonical NTP hydrolase)